MGFDTHIEVYRRYKLINKEIKEEVIIFDKVKVFRKELSWLQNKKIKTFATKAIEGLPDYFFTVAASSTGKYHPKYSLGDGGLVRHTKAAAFIAHELLNLEHNNTYTDDEKDLIITALILHDGLKHGLNGSKFTVATHPVEVANWIRSDSSLLEILPTEMVDILTNAISSHMGEWNTDYKTKKEILPKPKTNMEKFIHMCDYLASRKYLLFDFGDEYYESKNYKTKDLDNKIIEIISICKEKISNGYDKNLLYTVISNHNNGKKNPNAIKDIYIAQAIIDEITTTEE